MCTELMKQCAVCLEVECLGWQYCEPYMKTSDQVRRNNGSKIPASFAFKGHNPAINHDVRAYFSPDDCPNLECPSKIQPEEEN
ncbi:hypothetical protein FSARC_12129 [Fusarium sarcochroum]|uniref:Uncharacterized protein n=1 Tax=Fusarium sarcochroum TaxID=1208366 RepID=A0A8H4TB24_9HYPO|nr:hypothetical protein FSARC_12129 [Fusarium sarcochroum]